VWEIILGSSIVMIAFIILVLVVYYLTSFRGVKKQKEHFSQLHTALAKGQKVSFANGIYGVVSSVGTDTVDVQVKSGAIMTISRYAISEIMK
jgi:preprotein translocase subunit YajC